MKSLPTASIILVLLLCLPEIVSAQWGAGLGLSDTSFRSTPEIRPNGGASSMTASALFLQPLASQLRFSAEGMFLEQGGDYRIGSGIYSRGEWEARLRYFRLQGMLKLAVGQRVQHSHPFISAGLSVGFLRGANLIVDGASYSADGSYRSTSVAALMGAGYSLETPAGSFFAEVRYQLGLDDLSNDRDVRSLEMTGTQLLVGVVFDRKTPMASER